MFHTGVVSVSFRSLRPDEIVQAMTGCGLEYVEWGSDIHAPCTDAERLAEIVALQEKYGVKCCSYGTYFRLGVTPNSELPDYIRAAKMLGTKTLRLWAGTKRPELYDAEARDTFFAACREAAKIAEEAGVTLCMECHSHTYTETKEGALELMQAVSSPAFRMYWQSNDTQTVDENVAYIRLLKPYIGNIHVFHWVNGNQYPLALGREKWETYLSELGGDRMLLLEFVPDKRVESLPKEAQALRGIAAACCP